jgi:hypothetical protein
VHKAVTLASVVESEVGTPADRKVVAQVFFKRLQTGMRLQSDVTVHYGRSVNDTRYDTYSNNGLPVGPISNSLWLATMVSPTFLPRKQSMSRRSVTTVARAVVLPSSLTGVKQQY